MIRDKGVFALVTALVLSGAAHAAYNYRMDFTVSGYTGESLLTGFPVLVRLSPQRVPGFQYAFCQAQGQDIAFSSTDGTVTYPHEIERWDPSGESLVWVRLPELSGTTTSFSFSFGDPSASSVEDPTGVWRPTVATPYAGVWHFKETAVSPTAGDVNVSDSAQLDTATVNMDAKPKGQFVNNMESVEGPIGLARYGARTAENHFEIPNYDALNIGSAFTLSLWLKCASVPGWNIIASRSSDQWGTSGDAGYMIFFGNSQLRVMSGTAKSLAWKLLSDLPDMTQWTHIAAAFSADKIVCYVNGVKVSDADLAPPFTGNGKVLAIGSTTGGAASLYAQFDETRLLGTTASPDWVAAEYATATQDGFLTPGAVRVTARNAMVVSGSPAAYGTCDPDYGLHLGLVGGQEQACYAPAPIAVSDVLRVNPVGYRLYKYDTLGYRADEPYASANETNFVYTHVADDSVQLEWRFAETVPLVLEATRPASFRVDGAAAVAGTNWVERGEHAVEVSATGGIEGTDWTFVGWSNGGTGASTTVSVSGATTLRANYQSVIGVSCAGSDDEGEGTVAKPWRTVSKALSYAGAMDEIRICGGLYEENLTIAEKPTLALLGGYRSDGTRDLAGCPTVIKAADASKPVLTLHLSASNRIDGLALTGGSKGLWSVRSVGHRLTRLSVTNNVTDGLYFQSRRSWQPTWTESDPTAPLLVESCLIAQNGGCGICEIPGLDYYITARFAIRNCTVADNGGDGVRLYHCSAGFENDILMRNGGFGASKRTTDFSGWFQFSSCAIFGNVAGGLSDSTGYQKIVCALVFRGGNQRTDPQLDAAYCLTATSRCLKRGRAPSVGDDTVGTDLLGVAWGATRDIGCRASADPIVKGTRHAEVWVSADGDDDREGDTPETAVRTLSEGLLRTAQGGVCHVGAGAFPAPAEVDLDGVRLVGAGRSETVLGPAGDPCGDAILAVSAPNVTISGVTVRGGDRGLLIACDAVATNTVVADAELTGNRVGVSKWYEAAVAPTAYPADLPTTFLRRTRLVDNVHYGVRFPNTYGRLVADACLFAGCSSFIYGATTYGAGVSVQNNLARFYNCTFLDNAYRGIEAVGSWNNVVGAWNCAFDGNAQDWYIQGGVTATGTNCLLGTGSTANLVCDSSSSKWATGVEATFVFADAKLDRTASCLGRPHADSPAIRGGVNVEAETGIDVSCDVNGGIYSRRHRDIGCYACPCGFSIIIR